MAMGKISRLRLNSVIKVPVEVGVECEELSVLQGLPAEPESDQVVMRTDCTKKTKEDTKRYQRKHRR